jgi:septal ring factor EnvC (AmiA/AmiB activator)
LPAETNTDKIRKLESNLAILNERVDNVREDLKRHEDLAREVETLIRALERTSSVIDHRVSEVEKKLSESSSRRWELLRLVLAAILGAALTLGVTQANRWLNYQYQPRDQKLPEPNRPIVKPNE